MAEGEGGRGLGRLIRMAVIVLVVLVLVAGGAYAAWYFLLHKSPEQARGASATVAASAGKMEDHLEHPQYLDLGTYVVNLADGRRYLKTTMQLLLSEEGAKAYLNTRISEIKDLVNADLRTLTAESLRDPRTIEDLKQRILQHVETLLPATAKEWKDPRPVRKLLITEFYIQ